MASPILEIQNVSKTYSNHRALKKVSLTVPAGSIFGLLGPNGAGKTSLIRIITQITGADEGEVYFKGEKLQPEHIRKMGYLPEERGLYRKMEVGEQLIYFARLKGLSRNEAQVKLKDWVDKFEIGSWWKRKVEELSKGMQQKVQFIATVLHEPDLLILDEPFSGFDPINANLITGEILQLQKQGSTIIFSTHRMESVEQLCDHIALIHKSEKILEGAVQDIRSQNRTGTYLAEYSGKCSPSFGEWLQTKEIGNQRYQSIIRLKPGESSNNLLGHLLKEVEIVRFEEQIPGMEEIFIRAVSGNTDINIDLPTK